MWAYEARIIASHRPKVDPKILAFEPAELGKSLKNLLVRYSEAAFSPTKQDTKPLDSLLRPRRHRQRRRRAPEKRDEIAAVHYSITSSAVRRRASGMVSPIVFAVLRLIASSNRVGNSSGRSLTLAPRRMRSTNDAARCMRSLKSD